MNDKVYGLDADSGQSGSKISGVGLTFDDVLLVPRRSAILPRDANLMTQLTREISLNIPLISAAMDTVTEWQLAISIAREGGIGIIHKNLPVSEQAAQVDKVKRSESLMITNPITLPSNLALREALKVMHRDNISGIPIVDGDVLVGMLTQRDIRFATELDLPISKYMNKGALVTVKAGTSLDEAQKILHSERIEKLPVVDDDGRLVGLITAKDLIKRTTFPNACKDERGRLRVGAAVGVAAETHERAEVLINAGVDLIVVDTAHGHSEGVLRTVAELKNDFPDMQIIAGNVATGEAAKDLVEAGVDGVKVGIGAGAICTTRVIAGIGMPQISAVMACTAALEGTGVPVISDGGIRYSGDIAKALGAGANSVMLGSLFAGMEESPGETVLWEGRTYKVYYGMGSIAAMKKGSADRYFQEGAEPDKLVPEGIEGRVPYRGKLSETILQLTGGLKAAMGYCGCGDINTFRAETKFVRITPAGVRESHPHDVIISQESPNYQVLL